MAQITITRPTTIIATLRPTLGLAGSSGAPGGGGMALRRWRGPSGLISAAMFPTASAPPSASSKKVMISGPPSTRSFSHPVVSGPYLHLRGELFMGQQRIVDDVEAIVSPVHEVVVVAEVQSRIEPIELFGSRIHDVTPVVIDVPR